MLNKEIFLIFFKNRVLWCFMPLSLLQSICQCYLKTQNLTFNVCTSLQNTQTVKMTTTKNSFPTNSHYEGVDLPAVCDWRVDWEPQWLLKHKTTLCPVLSISVIFKLPAAAHVIGCLSLLSPLIICGCHHPYLTLDLSQNALGQQRSFSPKAFLTVRVTIATGCCWGISQSDDWVSWVSVSVGCCDGSWGWHGSSVGLKKRVQSAAHRPCYGTLVLGWVLSWVPALVLGLVIEQSDQEVDVLYSQAQDFVLAELLVRWVSGNEFPQLRESPVHILLSPALTAVGEDTASKFLRGAYWTHMNTVYESSLRW